jgi:hypothetical protein
MGDVSLTEPLGNRATSRSMQPYTGIRSSAGADLVFSRTRGTKMDTREIELKQGAAADLLRQGPQVEVADSGTSAVSSDEERLATGISTIGLQAEGPSGAKRRRLTRQGGMEGTWTAEIPPGGAPSSRVEGPAGGGGGVKGPQSDSSTPSLEGQQPKKKGYTSADCDI